MYYWSQYKLRPYAVAAFQALKSGKERKHRCAMLPNLYSVKTASRLLLPLLSPADGLVAVLVFLTSTYSASHC